MAEESPKKGNAAIKIKANSHPFTKATPNPPKSIEIVWIKVGTFSPMAFYMAKQS